MQKSKYGGAGRGYGDIRKASLEDASSFVVRSKSYEQPTTKELVLSATCLFLLCKARLYIFTKPLIRCVWILAVIVVFSRFFIHPISYVRTLRSSYSDRRSVWKRVTIAVSICVGIFIILSIRCSYRNDFSMVQILQSFFTMKSFELLLESIAMALVYETCIFRCTSDSDDTTSSDSIIKSFGITTVLYTALNFPYSALEDFLLCPVFKLAVLVEFATYPTIAFPALCIWFSKVLG